jgi:hypothetical protein
MFTNWNIPWRIFHTFFYNKWTNQKENTQNYLDQIAKDLLQKLELKEYVFHKVDFQGPSNFGTDYCWLALYPNIKNSHKDGYQFFLKIGNNSAVGTVAEHIGNVDDVINGDLLFSDFALDLALDLGLNFVPNAYENGISTTVDELGDVWVDIGVDNFLIEAWSMGSDRWIDFMNDTNEDKMTTP